MDSRVPAYAMNAIMNDGQSPRDFSATPNGQGIAQLISPFLSRSSSPYQKEESAYNQQFNKAVDTQNPFYSAGTAAIPKFQDWTNSMGNPSDFINHLMTQYQQSPWAKFQTEQGKRGLSNYASANGLSGSTPLSQFQEQYAHDISGEDIQKWLSNVLGINTQYGAGLQHQYDTGFNAGTNLSNLYGQSASDRGNLAYNKEQGNNFDIGSLISGALKIAPTFLPFLGV